MQAARGFGSGQSKHVSIILTTCAWNCKGVAAARSGFYRCARIGASAREPDRRSPGAPSASGSPTTHRDRAGPTAGVRRGRHRRAGVRSGRPGRRVVQAQDLPYDWAHAPRDSTPGGSPMPDFAARVLKLVSEPDYKPITLKAMSRRFEVDPDDYAEFRGDGQAADQGGEARPGQGQDAAPARPGGADHRPVPPVGQGLRVRPPARRPAKLRPDLHPARGQRRRLQRRRGRRQDHQAAAGGRG